MSHIYPTLQHSDSEPPLMQYWDEQRAKERCNLARKWKFGEGEVQLDSTCLCITFLYTNTFWS